MVSPVTKSCFHSFKEESASIYGTLSGCFKKYQVKIKITIKQAQDSKIIKTASDGLVIIYWSLKALDSFKDALVTTSALLGKKGKLPIKLKVATIDKISRVAQTSMKAVSWLFIIQMPGTFISLYDSVKTLLDRSDKKTKNDLSLLLLSVVNDIGDLLWYVAIPANLLGKLSAVTPILSLVAGFLNMAAIIAETIQLYECYKIHKTLKKHLEGQELHQQLSGLQNAMVELKQKYGEKLIQRQFTLDFDELTSTIQRVETIYNQVIRDDKSSQEERELAKKMAERSIKLIKGRLRDSTIGHSLTTISAIAGGIASSLGLVLLLFSAAGGPYLISVMLILEAIMWGCNFGFSLASFIHGRISERRLSRGLNEVDQTIERLNQMNRALDKSIAP